MMCMCVCVCVVGGGGGVIKLCIAMCLLYCSVLLAGSEMHISRKC